MAFEHYLNCGQKRLRMGYTTGTSATLAALAATELIFSGEVPEAVSIITPKGLEVKLSPSSWERISDRAAACGMIKDAGDDPDVTHGLEIIAKIELLPSEEFQFVAGPGVGTVTLPGLDQAPGEAAINSVPRQMIRAAITSVFDKYGHSGGARIEIAIPGGSEIAKKTFNPKLGIEGGLSILGTSGIVEPMSEQALIDTIELEIKRVAADGEDRLILTPGNYGKNFIALNNLQSSGVREVRFSNYLGASLDLVALHGLQEVLLVGHIGKFIKIAGGIMNTHSKMADCRLELMLAHAALQGASTETIRKLNEAPTTDAGLDILAKA
ncbi:MAG: cobalt-precorrin-5B (C(1))-methyltransferase CbiD, partial [Eubacteriales bacterium]|nr:cobalt-precorrin-5B (C(1))-methyltransferase CbiD [Eubacteriales bacterium]